MAESRALQDERNKRFASEVASVQFNVLVTTYEYIMRDRAKLSKVRVLTVPPADWCNLIWWCTRE